MPTYEYECRSCGYTFEKSQSMSEDPIKDCPACGKDVRRLIFGGSGVIFKGSGFYVNDSRGKKSSAGASSSDAKPGEAKPGDAKPGFKSAEKAASDAQAQPAEKAEKKPETAAPASAKEGS
ncbi:MAG TPA: FmdB family transcriptional regulator [Spirochaetaceae bacterium]|nr:FmdB family transcriptional regulator [Spirochaetaceae bacterium]